MSNQIDETLTMVCWQDLYRMADFHDKQAVIIRSRAQKLQQRAHSGQMVDQQIKFLKNTPKTVMRYLKLGHCIDRALQLTADHTDTPKVTIKAHWKNFTDSKKQNDIKLRDNLIMEMHGLGLSNVAISNRIDLHPVSVSRILSKKKKQRLYNPNPDKIELFIDRDTHKKTTLKKVA